MLILVLIVIPTPNTDNARETPSRTSTLCQSSKQRSNKEASKQKMLMGDKTRLTSTSGPESSLVICAVTDLESHGPKTERSELADCGQSTRLGRLKALRSPWRWLSTVGMLASEDVAEAYQALRCLCGFSAAPRQLYTRLPLLEYSVMLSLVACFLPHAWSCFCGTACVYHPYRA